VPHRLAQAEDRIQRWTPYVYVALVAMFTISQVFIGGFIIHQQHQIKDQQVSIRAQAKLAAATSAAIQKNRIETIRHNCNDQNLRHNAAVNALYDLLKKSGVRPERRRQAAASTIELINALAPFQDCDKVVQKAIPKKPVSKPKSEG
jgi:hypothetical protein